MRKRYVLPVRWIFYRDGTPQNGWRSSTMFMFCLPASRLSFHLSIEYSPKVHIFVYIYIYITQSVIWYILRKMCNLLYILQEVLCHKCLQVQCLDAKLAKLEAHSSCFFEPKHGLIRH